MKHCYILEQQGYTIADVKRAAEICACCGCMKSNKQLALMFKVSGSTITRILSGQYG